MSGQVSSRSLKLKPKIVWHCLSSCKSPLSLIRLCGRISLSIESSSVLWILRSLHRQSVLASLLVLASVSIPASCERGSRWSLSLSLDWALLRWIHSSVVHPPSGTIPVPAVTGLSCTLRRAADRRMSEQGKGSASASAAAPAPGSDTYKGWLFKWTNYLKGYQRRWFVLSNGLLSYYRYFFRTECHKISCKRRHR